MQTHEDAEHLRQLLQNDPGKEGAWGALKEEAERMVESGASAITAGTAGEEEVRSWRAGNVHVREYEPRELDRPLGLCRVSIGGTPDGLTYCVFRGDIKEVKLALRRALAALRNEP